METKGFLFNLKSSLSFGCLNFLFRIHSNTYVMGLRPLELRLLFSIRGSTLASESDVYRRPILTSQVDPRAVRVNPEDCFLMAFIIFKMRALKILDIMITTTRRVGSFIIEKLTLKLNFKLN